MLRDISIIHDCASHEGEPPSGYTVKVTNCEAWFALNLVILALGVCSVVDPASPLV